MAKKENGNATKSFILRVDAEMMEAIEAWAADEFPVSYTHLTLPTIA